MDFLECGRNVFETEINALRVTSQRLDEEFSSAVSAILNSEGRVVVCGMGKSGIIGRKIVASLASTGTPSFFLHPGEAFHGDLGMLKSEDVFLAISYSGETSELTRLLPFVSMNNNVVVAMSGNPKSSLAKAANFHLDVSVPREACPLNLAPTASTTAALVMGDALTVALMQRRGFKPENFAKFHPGGSLGRRLLGRVKDVMLTKDLPTVSGEAGTDALINTITAGRLGFVIVRYQNQLGLITDGDVRRAISVHQRGIFDLKSFELASFSPLTTASDVTIDDAISKMDMHNVNLLFVEDDAEFKGIFRR